MANGRVLDHPLLGPLPDVPAVRFCFNGQPVQAREGETIAAALWAAGIKTLRYTGSGREPRGVYCGIGHCYDCRVTVDGVPDVRACLEPVRAGLQVEGLWERQGPSADKVSG